MFTFTRQIFKASIILSTLMFAVGLVSAQNKSGGYTTIETPASRLEDVRQELQQLGIPSGIGVSGECEASAYIAGKKAYEGANVIVAFDVRELVSRIGGSFAQGVDQRLRLRWEDNVMIYVNLHQLNNATEIESIVQRNVERDCYKIYSLVVLNPRFVSRAVEEAARLAPDIRAHANYNAVIQMLNALIATFDNMYPNDETLRTEQTLDRARGVIEEYNRRARGGNR